MKPAERIPLLKKLATALAETADHREMHLILSEFGFDPEEGSWGTDYYGYALYHLRNGGSDEHLLELERCLDPSTQAERPSSGGSGPWKRTDTFRLFITHPHSHAAIAGEMRDFLSSFLIEAFVAHDDIEPSERWQQVIESALLTCHAATAIVTPEFRESAWCDQEVGFCIARSICIVPLLFGLDPHGFLGSFHGVKLNETAYPRQTARAAAVNVFDVLAQRPETQERMVPCIVRRYSASISYENTRTAFAQLSGIPKDAWTRDLVDEVEKAAENNSQVFDANLDGVSIPQAARKLLAPIKAQLFEDDIPF